MHRFMTIYSTTLPHKMLFGTNKFRKPKIICHTRSIHITPSKEKVLNKTVIPRERTIRIYQAEFNKIGQATFSLFKADTKSKKPLRID